MEVERNTFKDLKGSVSIRDIEVDSYKGMRISYEEVGRFVPNEFLIIEKSGKIYEFFGTVYSYKVGWINTIVHHALVKNIVESVHFTSK